jgi:translation elongation factor EF-4
MKLILKTDNVKRSIGDYLEFAFQVEKQAACAVQAYLFISRAARNNILIKCFSGMCIQTAKKKKKKKEKKKKKRKRRETAEFNE